MRRLLAYIIMAASMIFAVGVASTPVLTKLHEGREFSNGKEIIFKVDTEDYTGSGNPASEVAEIMRGRLDNYPVEDYSIKVQDNDTIVASFDVPDNEFNYVAKYLSFSGRDFTFSGKAETSFKTGHDILNVSEAKIEYQSEAKYPILTIPVTEQGKTDIKDIIKEITPEKKTVKRADDHDHDHDHDHEGEEAAPEANYIYLWANYEEGDSIELSEKDPLMMEKILMKFEINSIWWPDEKNPETKIMYTCATADESGQLMLSGLKDFNIQTDYLLNMITAEKYDYKVSCPTMNVSKDSMSVDYLENASKVNPSAETLVKFGSNILINVKSHTFIATVIALAIVTLILVVLYRVSSLAMVATTVTTTFLTLVAANKMNVIFNIPLIIGLILLASALLIGEIAYVNRFKEEIYKGRAIKKANQEAAKRTGLFIADVAFVSTFAGLMMYALGGSALKPMGVVLFFGGVFSLIANLIVFRILMHLVSNSSNLQTNYAAFNVDGSKVPNLMATEEKATYVAPYEKTDFTKHKKPFGICFGVLVSAAVALIAIMGSVSNTKSPLNVKDAVADTTVVYTSIEINSKNPLISDETSYRQYALTGIDLDGFDNVETKTVTRYNYNNGEEETTTTYFFIIKSNNAYNEEERLNYQTAISDNIETALNSVEYKLDVEVKNSQELNYTPRQGLVALATGITIVGVALYACLRFRPSRGISLLVTTGGTTAIAYGVMVATRAGTTAVTSLAMPIVAVTMMLASLFYFTTEKAMRKEGHIELTKETRNEIMVKALGKSALPMFMFMIIELYIGINYFAFGLPQTALLFVSAIFGEVIAVITLLTVTGPFAELIAQGLSKIHLPKLKIFERKEKPKQVQHNSSEPEETIFIGIND